MAFDYEKWAKENNDAQDAYMLKREMLSDELKPEEKPEVTRDNLGRRVATRKGKAGEKIGHTDWWLNDLLKMFEKHTIPTGYKGGWLSPPEQPPKLTKEWMWMHEAVFGDEDINGAFTEIAKSHNWWDNTNTCVTRHEASAEAPYRVEEYLKESRDAGND